LRPLQYVPLVVSTSRSFPHLRLITGCVTRLTRRVSLVEQELLTLPEHLSSPLGFSGVRFTPSLVLCVCFIDRCLLFCPFSYGHCFVCSPIYGLWLPLWYLQSLLIVIWQIFQSYIGIVQTVWYFPPFYLKIYHCLHGHICNFRIQSFTKWTVFLPQNTKRQQFSIFKLCSRNMIWQTFSSMWQKFIQTVAIKRLISPEETLTNSFNR
jgi:hypothetical protein